ncbi:MAG: hypothetical protein KA221_10470 [Vitreoscilla sp.]|nr:hypothetical protein [Vitreoscilla sp.]
MQQQRACADGEQNNGDDAHIIMQGEALVSIEKQADYGNGSENPCCNVQ